MSTAIGCKIHSDKLHPISTVAAQLSFAIFVRIGSNRSHIIIEIEITMQICYWHDCFQKLLLALLSPQCISDPSFLFSLLQREPAQAVLLQRAISRTPLQS